MKGGAKKFYKEIVETSHSGMYLYTPKTEFDSIFKNAKEQINTGKVNTDRAFFLLLAKIHTKINCGHSSTYPSTKIFSSIKESQKALFPIPVKFIKDTLVVAADYKELKKGTQLIKINNKSIDQIKKDAFEVISSDGFNTTFKYRQLEDDFAKTYFLLYGSYEKFDLETIPYQSNTLKQLTINAVTKEVIRSNDQKNNELKPYYLSYINKNTVLLTVNTFSTETRKNQKKFLMLFM